MMMMKTIEKSKLHMSHIPFDVQRENSRIAYKQSTGSSSK